MTPVQIIIAAVIGLGGLGAIFGTVLALASKAFATKTDPKVEGLLSVLPGTNCGACGKPSCRGYAEALAKGNIETNLCTPGGPEVARKIAAILGVQAVEGERLVAFCHCKGGTTAVRRFAYDGVPTCKAADMTAAGQVGCLYGCLGLYDCIEVCNYDAFAIQENGMPVVIPDKCVACQACLRVCTRNLFEMVPISAKVHVLCVNPERGKAVKEVCRVGCIGCALCVKPCSYDAIHMKDGIAVIDYSKCTNCSECAKVCPVDVIHDYQVQHWLTWQPLPRLVYKEMEADRKAKGAAKR